MSKHNTVNTLELRGGKGTAIGHVRGLGAAHHGTHHWLMQRFTSVGNLVSVLFLLISFLLLPSLDYATVRDWIGSALVATALGLMIVSVFYHARLGLTVLIEDYVDMPGNKFAAILAVNLAAVIGAGFGLFCIIRLALGAAA